MPNATSQREILLFRRYFGHVPFLRAAFAVWHVCCELIFDLDLQHRGLPTFKSPPARRRGPSKRATKMSDSTPERSVSRRGLTGLALMPTLLLSMGLLVLLSVGSILALNWVTCRSVVQGCASRLIARGPPTHRTAPLRQRLA